MCIAYDNHKASENMNEPPEGSYTCYYVRLFICLSYFLAKRLCPDTPPFLKHVSHRTNINMCPDEAYLQKLLLFHIRSYALVHDIGALVHDLLAMSLSHEYSRYEF
jgi:hypothetical protein